MLEISRSEKNCLNAFFPCQWKRGKTSVIDGFGTKSLDAAGISPMFQSPKKVVTVSNGEESVCSDSAAATDGNSSVKKSTNTGMIIFFRCDRNPTAIGFLISASNTKVLQNGAYHELRLFSSFPPSVSSSRRRASFGQQQSTRHVAFDRQS